MTASTSSSSSDVTIAGPSNIKTHIDLHHTSPEIIIVGAGIAGSALAYALSHSGRSCLLIERDLSEPDRIVGELLQPGGVRALSQLGLAGVLDGIDAVPVEGYCVVSGGRQVGIPYPDLDQVEDDSAPFDGLEKDKIRGEKEPLDPGNEKASLKPTSTATAAPWYVPSKSGRKEGRSFHHGRVISALRQRCMYDAPNLTVVEGSVRQLVRCEDTSRVIGIQAAFKLAKPAGADEGAEQETIVRNIYAPITIIADGCFSKFRSQPGLKLPTPKTRSHFVGVVVKDVDLPLPRHGTVCLTPEGPVLLYQIGDKGRETRMLVDVKGKLPSVADGSLKNYILDLYLPHLPLEVQPAVRHAIETQRLRTMPNSFLPPTQQGKSNNDALKGAIMIGDSWNMRHPLTGGGMTVAFSDAVLLTEILRPSDDLPGGREGLEWELVAPKLRAWFWERKKLSSVVNIMSVALYDLFGGADADLAILREGCFRYFELGGECVSGPVSLLSAITPAPLLLAYHFFSVAFYSIYILFKFGVPPPPSQVSKAPGVLEWPYTTYLAFRVFYTACVVFLPLIWTEIRP